MFEWVAGALMIAGFALLIAAARTGKDWLGYLGGAIAIAVMLVVIFAYAPLI